MSIAPRSRTAAPLPDETLQLPAMIAVKALLYLRDDLRTLAIHSQNPLSQDARLIIDKCQELQSRLQQPPSCTELEHYALDLYTMLVDSYSREIVLSLSYATRLKLSLIVWHFDASSREPSPELLAFLRSPNDKKVLETIHVRYQDQIRQQVLYDDFIFSFDFLLSSQLPRKHPDSQPEFGDSQHQLQPPRSLVNRRFRSDPFLRQGQFITPVYPSSSSSQHLQPFTTYTNNPNNCGRSYSVDHHGQSLCVPVGGQDGHHATSLPQPQPSSLPTESHMSIRSPRGNAARQSDPSTGALQHRPFPYHITSYQESGKSGIRPKPPPPLPHWGVKKSDTTRKEKNLI